MRRQFTRRRRTDPSVPSLPGQDRLQKPNPLARTFRAISRTLEVWSRLHGGIPPTQTGACFTTEPVLLTQFSTKLATWPRTTFLSRSSTILLTFHIFMLLISQLLLAAIHARLAPSSPLYTLQPGIHSRLINFTILPSPLAPFFLRLLRTPALHKQLACLAHYLPSRH